MRPDAKRAVESMNAIILYLLLAWVAWKVGPWWLGLVVLGVAMLPTVLGELYRLMRVKD